MSSKVIGMKDNTTFLTCNSIFMTFSFICGSQMRIIAFIEDPKATDKIIRHLKLSFQAARPPTSSQVIQQELLLAAEQWSEYF